MFNDRLNAAEYYKYVQSRNTEISNNYSDRLGRIASSLNLNPNENIIVAGGSDGKLERHPQSLTEINWIGTKDNNQLKFELTNAIKSEPNLKDEFEFFSGILKKDGFINFYNIDSPAPLSYVNSDPRSIYPDNLFNSNLLYGSFEMWVNTRKRILEEGSSSDEVGKKIRGASNKQLSSYRNALSKGEYRQQKTHDPIEGIQYYYEDPTFKQATFGLKMPLLRLVQRSLDRLVINTVRNDVLSIDYLAKNLPTPVVDRIGFLTQIGILPTEALDTAEAYQWALKEYHRAQEEFKLKPNKVAQVSFNPESFDNYSQIIYDFSLNT